MKTLALLAVCLASSAFARGPRSHSLRITLPERPLLEAGRRVVPQTGPAYSLSGMMTCTRVVNDLLPPYQATASCSLTVFDYADKTEKTVDVPGADGLIAAIQKAVPPTGQAYSVTGYVFAREGYAELLIPDAR